jgi:predicted transcriptional regulator
MGEGNVKDVRRALAANRNLAYTTVMTVLDRLARKGGVARRKVGRSFVYAPVLRRENLRRLAIRDLVDRFFDGSEDALVDYLRNGHFSPAVAEGVDDEVRLDAALL